MGRPSPGPDAPTLRLLLAGDVMTGRGVDQVLPAPGDPALKESYVHDARDYVALAERAHGPVPRRADPSWPWGDLLRTMDRLAAPVPCVRVMNLETSVTRSDDAAPGKAVHYRMSPANVACLVVAHVDVWTLANNHVLDYGERGLRETLATLAAAGQRTAGAGVDDRAAWTPAEVAAGPGRVHVWSVGHGSSGVPASWSAAPGRPGVALLPDLGVETADRLARRVRERRRPGDVVVVSVHWGSNWGYAVPEEQVRFAHRLVDQGVDVVHGHSSHHPRPVEVYRDRLVLYGCGDLVDDYEGIGGEGERYRDDLRLLFVADLGERGRLRSLRLVPFRARRLRLEPAPAADAAWLARTLDEVSRGFGSRVHAGGDGSLEVVGDGSGPR